MKNMQVEEKTKAYKSAIHLRLHNTEILYCTTQKSRRMQMVEYICTDIICHISKSFNTCWPKLSITTIVDSQTGIAQGENFVGIAQISLIWTLQSDWWLKK